MKAEVFTLYFVVRFAINTVAMVALVRLVYFPIHRKREFNFTFFLLNFIVFVLTFLLDKTGAFGSVGTAFGLLAAFSLLRLRTETISIKDVTYLFIIMTLGLMNATMKGPYYELIVLNIAIIGLAYALDGDILTQGMQIKTIELNGLELIHADKQDQLITELKEKTGLDIRRINIEHIDFARNRATVKVFYH